MNKSKVQRKLREFIIMKRLKERRIIKNLKMEFNQRVEESINKTYQKQRKEER